MIFSQVLFDSPIRCGLTGCPSWIVDPQHAIFIVTVQETLPFCCQGCFAQAIRNQARQHEVAAAKDPLERLGYVPEDAI